MINRRKFVARSAASVLGMSVLSSSAKKGVSEAPGDIAQANAGGATHSTEPQDPFPSDDSVEVMLDALFGVQRNEPTPLPTIEHLEPADLCFVVFTDAHMGSKEMKRYNTQKIYNWRTEQAVRQINALNPEFALHLGDSIWAHSVTPDADLYDAAARQAMEIFGKLTCRFYNTAGTHDFNPHHPITKDPAVLRILNDATVRYEKYFGKNYYSFEAKGHTFVIFNNALANVDSPQASEQMEWLKQQLTKSDGPQLKFFASHEPFFLRAPDEDEIDSKNAYLQPARAKILKLLSSMGVNVVYNGHLHFSIANEYLGMYLHGINSCGQNRYFLAESGTPVPFPTEAQVDDPYKLGYLVVRIRANQIHESWVSTYWRVRDPSPELLAISGARLVARPATETDDSVLGIVAAPPEPVIYDGHPTDNENMIDDLGSMVNDHWWRSGENVGSKWLQMWPMPVSDESWRKLERGLTLGRPRGVRIAVPVPSDGAALGETWTRLEPHKSSIDAVMVCNGAPLMSFCPSMYNPQLVTWNPRRGPEEWAVACKQARELVPSGTKVILGRITLRQINGAAYSAIKSVTARPANPYDEITRLPYPSDFGEPSSGLETFRKVAATLKGNADGIAAWIETFGPPEEYADEIASAARIARENGLELWLDAVGWDYVSEPIRSAYFLRLLALCQASGVRLFWWNGPSNKAGLLDGFYDPTEMYYAAQVWQSFTDLPKEPVPVIKVGDVNTLQWTDNRGRKYKAWWRPAKQVTVEMGWKGIQLPSGSIVADPLHGRLLKIDPAKGLPVSSWPLVARFT